MISQFCTENYKPNGLKVKKGLKLAMALAVCIWLVYQIQKSNQNHSRNDGVHGSEQLQEHGTVNLGRKSVAGSADGGAAESENGSVLRETEGEEDVGIEGESEPDMGDGVVHGFHDENGVPPDGFELVNSTPHEATPNYQAQTSYYSSRDDLE